MKVRVITYKVLLIFFLSFPFVCQSRSPCSPSGQFFAPHPLDDLALCSQGMSPCTKPMKTNPSLNCEQSLIDKPSNCAILNHLATQLSITPAQLYISDQRPLSLLTLNYPGDGQKAYALLSEEGCLFSLTQDPRLFIPTLKAQYGQANWLFVPQRPPYQSEHHQMIRWTVPLFVRSGCLACANLKTIVLYYDFNSKGQLKRVHYRFTD